MATAMRTVLERLALVPKLLSIFVVLAVLVSLVVALVPRHHERYLTVDFTRTVSLYQGSDVRILGVPVGTVQSIQPRGDTVRVRLSYDAKYKVPANVKAAIVSPSLIGDRFVQLTPAYSGGKTLANNAYLDTSRTATPVELDKVYQSLDDLSVALGPKGANKHGALSSLLDSTARAIGGEGTKINQTVTDVSKLSGTLSDNKDKLFGSVQQIDSFVQMLKDNDKAVRGFNSSLADVSTVLAGERHDLAKTLALLASTLQDVDTFVKTNRKTLRANVHDLTEVTNTIVKNRHAFNETLKAAPTALSNLAFTYNQNYGTLDTRAALPELLTNIITNPTNTLCAILGEAGKKGDVCKLLGGVLPDLSSLLPGGLLPRVAIGPDGTTPDPDPVSDSLSQMLAVN